MTVIRPVIQQAACALLGVLALAGLCGAPTPAHGFVVDRGPDATGDPRQDLIMAPRWDAKGGSLVRDGVRGLGGGLEYAIDSSVCTALNFVDQPSCADVRAQIREAADMWGAGHALIEFTDVTGTIAPVRAPQDTPWRGHGAEIDFFADPASSFTGVHAVAVGADARTYYRFDPKPRDPLGRVLTASRGAYTAVDIRFNQAQCFYLRADAERPGCMHFGSVVVHELAHAIGLDHPDSAPERNLDTDASADNDIVIDCRDPLRGLRVNRTVSARAVTSSRVAGARAWTLGLSADDRAGRDALYPSCEGGDQAPAWAAFAVSADGAFGWSRAYDDPETARRRALLECAALGRGCRAQATFSECFAVARARSGAFGWSVRRTPSLARERALENCLKRGGGACAVEAAFCAGPASKVSASAARPGL